MLVGGDAVAARKAPMAPVVDNLDPGYAPILDRLLAHRLERQLLATCRMPVWSNPLEVGPLSPEAAVEQMIRSFGARCQGSGRGCTPHLLRHSFTTMNLRRGGNGILLQQILGHSSLSAITQTCQHLTLADAHDELMRLLAADPR